jgi:hypothetical protein
LASITRVIELGGYAHTPFLYTQRTASQHHLAPATLRQATASPSGLAISPRKERLAAEAAAAEPPRQTRRRYSRLG